MARKNTRRSQPTGPAQPDSLNDSLTLVIEGLRYKLDRPPERGGGKVIVAVTLEDGGDAPFRDRADLFAFNARDVLAQRVADAFGRRKRETLGHLTVLLDQVERAGAREPELREVMTGDRREHALTLLKRRDLLDCAASALNGLGYVGEERVKRLAYLVATSRLLPKPLSAILLAPSGSGKSELLDAVAALLPGEGVEYLSRITKSALYYAGEDALRHKLVVVDEQAGSAEADYAVRTLQSKGMLRMAIPVRGKTESFEARGPIALMSGTTATNLNAENLSRCLQLPLDDSPEQTRRVQEAQRAVWSGERRASVDVQLWQDAQRLLEPLSVVIPYASFLRFPARTTHDRRGNQKLFGLIAAHALLCQHQRERDHLGRVIATRDDYTVIHSLVAPLVDQDIDGLPPRAARLFRLLADNGNGPITRREAAARLGWGYNTAKRALDDLEAQELVVISDRRVPRHYALLDRSVLGASAELVDPRELS